MFHVKPKTPHEPAPGRTKRYVRSGGTLCSKCHDAAPVPGQRYCKPCHAAVMRAFRAKQKEKLIRMTALARTLMQEVQP